MGSRAIGPAVALLAVLAVAPTGCDRSGVVSPTVTLSSTAGTVDVRCVGHSRVQIVGSQPAPGYTATVIVAGPTYQASLRFSSPTANDYKVFVSCSDAQPFVTELEVEDATLAT